MSDTHKPYIGDCINRTTGCYGSLCNGDPNFAPDDKCQNYQGPTIPFHAGAPDCKEYSCQLYGAYECPGTRILDYDPNYKCKGPVKCSECKYSGLDGRPLVCSNGNANSNHYCNYMYLSGFYRKETNERIPF